MPISTLLLPEFDAEIATTRRVLERVPEGRGEWRPHPKSFPLSHLAQLVARLPGWTNMVMDSTEFDIAPKEGSKYPGYSIESPATILAEFEKSLPAARAAIEKASDADFQVPWTFKKAGEAQFTQPRYMMLRTMMLNHLVHHRAQLGVYLRLLDAKVPQMYGPTADEAW